MNSAQPIAPARADADEQFLDTVTGIADGPLAGLANRIDQEGYYPLDIMAQLGQAGALGAHLDGNGQRFDLAIAAMQRVSRRCGTTGFLVWAHQVCGLYLEQSGNPALSGERLAAHSQGLRFGGTAETGIVPDVLVAPDETGGWKIRINEASLPRLVVNREYYVELKGGARDKKALSWLNEQLSEADWLIRALDQRQKTILKTAAEIVRRQEGFFRSGVSAMKTLTLREVAEAIAMHESTVSRVTSNKYLSCPRGTFELKYFFASGVAAADGEGASSEAIKARIRALCDGEDPKAVLSDQKLVDLLKAEGFDLARRTVAKYREAIGIGSSAQRRRAKKLANY